MVIKSILMEFPVKQINFNLPKWVMALGLEDEFIQSIYGKIKEKTYAVYKMNDYKKVMDVFDGVEGLKPLEVGKLNLSSGEINFNVLVEESLFYETLSKVCGIEIKDDYNLMTYMKDLVKAKREYDKIQSALETVKEKGYGIVTPNLEDLELQEPEIVTKNGMSSIKLKATAPSLHIMRVDVNAEVCPAVGSGENGALVSYLSSEFENNKSEIWNKNMFGKPMNELVKETIDSKLSGLPEDVQTKMRKTITKIVNERKGGIICILL